MPNFVRYSDSDLRRIFGDEIPRGAAGLREVALPREADVFFAAYLAQRVGLSAGSPGRLAIGRAWHGVCEVHVDLGDGSVWAVVAVDGDQPEVTFMNSDIQRFTLFLQRIHGMVLLAEVADGPVYRAEAEAARRELAQADEPATREGAWWAGIIDEMVAAA